MPSNQPESGDDTFGDESKGCRTGGGWHVCKVFWPQPIEAPQVRALAPTLTEAAPTDVQTLTLSQELPTAEVIARVVDAMDAYEEARYWLSECAADRPYPSSLGFELHERLLPAIEYLGDAHDIVASTWVAADPPEFEPDAASVLEGVLRVAAKLWACVDQERGTPFKDRCRLALQLTPHLNRQSVLNAIRREARCLDIHPAEALPGSAQFEELLEEARELVCDAAFNNSHTHELKATKAVTATHTAAANPSAELGSLSLAVCNDSAPLQSSNRSNVKGKDINARMLATIQAIPDSVGWSSRQWASRLGCSPSTVAESTTWKGLLKAARAIKAADEAMRMDRSQTSTARSRHRVGKDD